MADWSIGQTPQPGSIAPNSNIFCSPISSNDFSHQRQCNSYNTVDSDGKGENPLTETLRKIHKRLCHGGPNIIINTTPGYITNHPCQSNAAPGYIANHSCQSDTAPGYIANHCT
ncbi:hypothetical protein LguiA_007743 [Lonicera macranthoides]